MMHEQVLAEAKYHGGKVSMIPAKVLGRLKAQWVLGTQNAMNTIGSWYQVAKREGEFWDKIVTLVTGHGVADHSRFKKFSSAAHWVPMGDMPDKMVMDLLDDCILGHKTIADFRNACKMHKCRKRFEKTVADHVEVLLMKDSQTYFDDFENLSTKELRDTARWNWIATNLPSLATDQFVMMYVKIRFNVAAKHGFPETLYEDCEKAYKKWKEAEEAVQTALLVFKLSCSYARRFLNYHMHTFHRFLTTCLKSMAERSFGCVAMVFIVLPSSSIERATVSDFFIYFLTHSQHTHTHTHIYTHIYIYLICLNLSFCCAFKR